MTDPGKVPWQMPGTFPVGPARSELRASWSGARRAGQVCTRLPGRAGDPVAAGGADQLAAGPRVKGAIEAYGWLLRTAA
jgi:hypothetical protein